jgi:histidine triad (HIT) family protein
MADNKNCLFCKIVNGEIESDILFENDNFIAIPDAKPKTEGHTLIISKKHFRNLLDMPVSLGSELLEAIKKVTVLMIKDEKAEGYNIHVNGFKAGGQIVNHAHVHILPRKENDGFEPCA